MKCHMAFLYLFAAVIAIFLTASAWADAPTVFPQCGHSKPLAAIAFSPNGRLIMSGGDDRKVVFWDIAAGRELYAFNLESARVNSVIFSPDGRSAAAGWPP